MLGLDVTDLQNAVGEYLEGLILRKRERKREESGE